MCTKLEVLAERKVNTAKAWQITHGGREQNGLIRCFSAAHMTLLPLPPRQSIKCRSVSMARSHWSIWNAVFARSVHARLWRRLAAKPGTSPDRLFPIKYKFISATRAAFSGQLAMNP